MPRLLPACSERRAASHFLVLGSTSLASSASQPRGGAAVLSAATLSPPVLPRLSTLPAFWPSLTAMPPRTSSLPLATAARPAIGTVNRILADGFQRNGATPNLAQQRTATAVTAAAIHVRCPLLRAGRCPTLVASFFAPPSQPPRQPPRSLSLRSLGASSSHP